jgi:hypothetical protein
MYKGEVATVSEDPEEKQQRFEAERSSCNSYFIDDVSGRSLDSALVKQARAEEIRGAISHKVYQKVPIQECYQVTGSGPIDTRWVDVNKGDDEHPDYRSRWVGREFKGTDNDRDDLFAATPPLEAKKALIALAASQCDIQGPIKKLGFIDIKKAYFHAKVKRPLYVKLPAEALEPGEEKTICGKLNYSLYGTRDAASNWEQTYTEFMIGIGFEQGKSSPCIFRNAKQDIVTVVHGDDFTSLAPEKSLRWLANEFKKKFEIKDRGILGPDPHDLKEIRLLNRIIAWEADGIRLEADQRHAEILEQQLLLKEAKGLDVPGTKDTSAEDADGDSRVPVSPQQATLYRACAARCNFLALDRPDIQFSAKEVSRGMSSPTPADFIKLKRLARYIKKYPRMVFKFKHQRLFKVITAYSDADWAGCVKTRKSTQGGIIILGRHCVKTWSSTQAFIAMSSGESEYYGLVKSASAALGMQSMFVDMGIKLDIQILTDASAAKGIACRKGLSSRTRHVAVHYLWLQDKTANGEITVSKVWGEQNYADLLTKYLPRDKMAAFCDHIGLTALQGRSPLAPTIAA